MSSDNLIRQNYASYSTNPNSKYKPEELDKWANSSENYNSFINGEQVEDFQLFDYISLGDTKNERISGYKQELDVFSQEYISQYDADGNNELSIDEFINMQSEAYETIFGEEADDTLTSTFENQFNTLSTINPNERYIDESTLKSILGVGQNTNIDSYMEKYDSDGDGKLTFDDYKKFHEDQSEEILGEKTNWDAPGMLEAVKANFNQISKVSSSANAIDSREFATFLGIADAQDGLNDGVISYQNFNSVPALEGYEEATENYYEAFFGDSEEETSQYTTTEYSHAEVFDNWTNSSENYNNFINGGQVEDFQLFDYNSLGDTKNERISGYKQELNQFAQEYIDQYDSDGNSSLDMDEFINMQAQSYKETFGEELNTDAETVAYGLQQQFNSLNALDQDSSSISANEFAAFLGVADSQDGLNDGIISYSNFNTVPQQNGYETALKNHYNDFFNN